MTDMYTDEMEIQRDGEWMLVDGEKICNFLLKIVGYCLPREDVGHTSSRPYPEDRWICEIEGWVCNERKRRVIILKCSDFDSKKLLLDAVRTKFGGEVRTDDSTKDSDIEGLWGCLEGEFRTRVPETVRTGYIAEHLGYQSLPNIENYWYLGKELHIENNAALPEEAFRVFSERGDLQAMETTLNREFLDPLVMKDAMVSLMARTTFFGVNSTSFQLALAFLASRILRARESSTAWRESNIGLLYSEGKNCGKSLALRLFAHLQGASLPHPILCAGGDSKMSGMSIKVLLQKASRTSLTLLLDGPVITATLSEYLNQLQSGLPQGSLSSGIYHPKGSILIASNSKESSRLEGSVLRFDFAGDPNHSSGEESRLTNFVEGNKGLIVAWGMRMMALWPDVAERVTAIKRILDDNIPQSSVTQQDRWKTAVANVLLVNMMIHATAESEPGTAELIQTLRGNRGTVSVLERLQRSILQRIREDDVAALTWINPSVRVTLGGAEAWVPAMAIRKTAFDNLAVSWSEVCEATREIANKTTAVAFARDSSATLRDLRQKTRSSTTAQGIKISRAALDQTFLDWINYHTGEQQDQPEEKYPIQGSGAAINNDDLGRLELIEQEVKDLVADLFA